MVHKRGVIYHAQNISHTGREGLMCKMPARLCYWEINILRPRSDKSELFILYFNGYLSYEDK